MTFKRLKNSIQKNKWENYNAVMVKTFSRRIFQEIFADSNILNYHLGK